MTFKIVNLNAGLNLQDEDKHVGFDGFRTLQNVRQLNGQIVKRYGTGSPTTMTSANIDNMVIFVHRKLQSASVAVGTSGSTSAYYFTASAKTLTLSDTDGVTIPGSTSKDWTTVFKVDDTIYISGTLSTAGSAKNDGIYVISAITSTVITFENATVDMGTSGSPITSGTLTIGFLYEPTSAGTELIEDEKNRVFGTSPDWVNASSSNNFDTFDEATTSGATEGGYFSDNYLKIVCTSDGSNRKYGTLDGDEYETDMVVGRRYRLSYSVHITSYTSGTLGVGTCNDSFTVQDIKNYTAITGPKTDYIDFTFDSSVKKIIINAATSTALTAYFDNFSLKEIASPVTYADSNSFDGRAFLSTYLNTNKYISMINPLDYSDNTVLENFGTGSSDIIIRPKAYADAVRFSCGLEDSPRIFRYVNRHFFNGLFKSTQNVQAPNLYPKWVLDTAVPVIESDTYISSLTELDATNDFIKFIDGSLDLTNNVYNYKIVPVYDGTQEELLENSVVDLTTQGKSTKRNEPNGILSKERSCIKIKTVIDLTKLNPRTSALNVYRSTNRGAYYKIKTIIMGEDDNNQAELYPLRSQTDAIWWTGGWAGTGSTFNSHLLMVDGYKYSTDDGTAVADWNGKGYTYLEVENDSSAAAFTFEVTDDANMSPEYYGAAKICKFNHPAEETETIFANNGEAIGGSANGGWYFASGIEDADFNTVASFDEAVGLPDALSNDTSTPGPFTTAFATGNQGDGSNAFHYSFTNPGFLADFPNGKNDALSRWELGTGVTGGTTYTISGWIRASGFNHPSAEWRFFLDDTSHTNITSTGKKVIASGKGGDINQNIDKWRYFQFEYTPSTTTIYAYVRIYTTAEMGTDTTNMIRMKALSVREKLSTGLLGGAIGFFGANVAHSSKVGTADETVDLRDLNFSDGALKGNRIINNTTYTYPSYTTADRTYITNNSDVFLQTASDIENVSDSIQTVGPYYFGTSNYQFYIYNTDTELTNAGISRVGLNFFDPGLPDGARHPNDGVTSLDVKHKYATMLNGRQFVANVKISADGETEEYPNFVMYSNPNSPDIIPVGNFIQLQDLQGGEIVGIETLMSDLVVFMTNGIFRISVPNSDPSSWSLVEAHPNIGCLHDKAIAKAPNGIFFLSKSDIIFLDSGFNATPISYPIRDTYQSYTYVAPSLMRIHFDVKENRLYILYDNTTNTSMFMYNLHNNNWSTELHGGVVYDEFTLDDTNETLLIVSDTSSTIRKAVDTAEYRDAGATAITFTILTGKENLSSFDKNSYIRRVNIDSYSASGGDDIDLTLLADGVSVFTLSQGVTGLQSLRTSGRGKYVSLLITHDSNNDKKKLIRHVDIEYE